jgi:hypothetical protein
MTDLLIDPAMKIFLLIAGIGGIIGTYAFVALVYGWWKEHKPTPRVYRNVKRYRVKK